MSDRKADLIDAGVGPVALLRGVHMSMVNTLANLPDLKHCVRFRFDGRRKFEHLEGVLRSNERCVKDVLHLLTPTEEGSTP